MNDIPQAIAESVFSGLEPVAVWAHFARLCRIPRQSKAEGPLRDEIRQWALARGLVSQLLPAQGFAEAALAYAESLAKGSPASFANIKMTSTCAAA